MNGKGREPARLILGLDENALSLNGTFWDLNKHKTQQDSWSETGMIGSPEEESEGA